MANDTATISFEQQSAIDGNGPVSALIKDGERGGKSLVKPVVSVIIPIRNMEESVDALYSDLVEGLNAYGQPFEIVFVDDASTDSTWHLLEVIAQKDKRLKLIRMRNAFGEASALDAAMKHIRGEIVLYAAVRVRPNLKSVSRLLEKLDDNHDLVVGWREPRKDSKLNQKVSRWFNRIVSKLVKVELQDVHSSVFVTRRSVLDNLTLYGNLNIFIPVFAANKGYRVTEEKIEQLPGKFRQSRYPTEYIQRALDIVAVLFLTKYSKKPLHFLGFFGMVFTLAGAGMNLYLFFYRIFGFGAIAGRPLLLLGALLLVIGLQMISIGLIGEMIIYTHARDIQEYNIETVVGE